MPDPYHTRIQNRPLRSLAERRRLFMYCKHSDCSRMVFEGGCLFEKTEQLPKLVPVAIYGAHQGDTRNNVVTRPIVCYLRLKFYHSELVLYRSERYYITIDHSGLAPDISRAYRVAFVTLPILLLPIHIRTQPVLPQRKALLKSPLIHVHSYGLHYALCSLFS